MRDRVVPPEHKLPNGVPGGVLPAGSTRRIFANRTFILMFAAFILAQSSNIVTALIRPLMMNSVAPMVSLIVLAVAAAAWQFWLSSIFSSIVGATTVVGSAVIVEIFPERWWGSSLALINATPWIGIVIGFSAGGVAIRMFQMTPALRLALIPALLALHCGQKDLVPERRLCHARCQHRHAFDSAVLGVALAGREVGGAVGARPAAEAVAALPAGKPVIAVFAVERVVAAVADQRVVAAATGQCYAVQKTANMGVRVVAFSPDGEWLAYGGIDFAVYLWRWRTDEAPMPLWGHTDVVRALDFSLAAPLLVSGSVDGTVRLWDVATGTCCQILCAPGPYAGMNITDIRGISDAQKATLRALGAVEE